MVRVCAVKSCKNEYYPDCGLSFHSFPKEENLREKWMNVFPNCLSKITKSSVICSKHFKPHDYVPNLSRPVLKENAVPSISCLLPVLERNSEDFPIVYENKVKQIPYEAEEMHFQEYITSKDINVQTDNKGKDIEELKREIKVLRQKVVRRNIRIKKLKTLLLIYRSE